MKSVGTCPRCGREGRLARRDLCSACYQRLWKVGELPPLPPRPDEASRPRRDCRCKRAQHQHGTRLGYSVDGCRCIPCTAANTAEMAELRATKTRARWLGGPATPSELVDAGPAREHLQALMAAGMGIKTIITKGRLSGGTVSGILYGRTSPDPREVRPPRARIRRDVERRVLAVTLDLAAGASMDSTGTRRRLQALMAIGWSQARLCGLIGTSQQNVSLLMRGERRVLKGTAEKVRSVYDQRWSGPPPARNRWEHAGITRARSIAAEHGWPPPMAWDDDSIEDPAAQPDLGRRVSIFKARIDDAIELLLLGEHPERIAARLGVSLAALSMSLRRHAPEHAAAFERARRSAA